MKAYLANSLFSKADRLYNTYISSLIREEFPKLELFVPQESEEINDKSNFADSIMIATYDTEKLLESDFLIAIIDGVEIDAGVATEIGIFSTTGKPIFGVYTDTRQYGADNKKKIDALIENPIENQFMYRNLFTVGVIKKNGVIVSSTSELLNTLQQHVRI